MLLAIFLLLYFEGAFFYVRACLSSPQRSCSVASYQYSAGCRAQFDSRAQLPPPNVYASGQYHGFLGEGVHAKAYSERSGSSDFAKNDADIQCKSSLACSWRNVDEDQLDWVVGEGRVDPIKLVLITGSQTIPDSAFLILASDPRPSFHAGMLVSPLIGCQQSTGILSFRYWRSRSRTIGLEPDLDVCTRKALDSTLDNCLTITPTVNHTIVASIPPLLEPFEIVIRGFGFENEPEGGLILLDQIDYFAHIDQPENCVPKKVDENEIEPFFAEESSETQVEDDFALEDEETTTAIFLLSAYTASNQSDERRVVSGDTDDSDFTSVLVGDVIQRDDSNQTKPKKQKEDVTILSDDSEGDNCKALNCFMTGLESPCEYKRVGEGASGQGFYNGWKASSLRINKANRLTGIHISPRNDDEDQFLIAEFSGFTRNRQPEKFVLESPEFLISDGPEAYLSFKKFIATQGVEMTICEDSEGHKCFWDVFEHSAEPFARKWTKEVVLLPGGITRFFFICSQDLQSKANNGQVGLTEIGLFQDSQATIPLC